MTLTAAQKAKRDAEKAKKEQAKKEKEKRDKEEKERTVTKDKMKSETGGKAELAAKKQKGKLLEEAQASGSTLAAQEQEVNWKPAGRPDSK